TNYVPRGATQVIISPQLTEQFVLLLTELSYRQQKIEFFWLKGQRATGKVGVQTDEAKVQTEEVGVETEEEQRLLANLRKAGITYYILVDNQSQQMLARGGGTTYASSTQSF